MVVQDENRYWCGCSCWTLPSRLRKRIQLVLEHTSSACRPPRLTRYFSVMSSAAIPAPRAARAAGERSKTRTSQPTSRSTSAAVRPPIDPPTTLTVGIWGILGNELYSFRTARSSRHWLRAAERGDLKVGVRSRQGSRTVSNADRLAVTLHDGHALWVTTAHRYTRRDGPPGVRH